MSVSVDGFVGGPNGELDWIFRSLDKDATAWTMENVWRAGTPAEATWAAARVARGDLAAEIGRLKQEPGKEIMAHGGAGFARSLVRLGLVDEYRLLVSTVALGRGLGLFSSLARPIDLELISTSAFPGGAIAKIYRPC